MKTIGLTLGTLGLAGFVLAAEPAKAPVAGKSLPLGTQSAEAEKHAREVLRRVELFQFGPQYREDAEKAVAADPEFALGHYLLGTSYPGFMGNQSRAHYEKADALAPKAPEPVRRYLEAQKLARDRKHEEAVKIYEGLAAEYPSERLLHIAVGQTYGTLGKWNEAKAAYEKAISLDAKTPRGHALLASVLVMTGDYAGARKAYEKSISLLEPGAAPNQPHYGLALTHVYESHPDDAVKVLQGFLESYRKAAGPFPEVFIWNTMARIQLEHGRPEKAIEAYEKGFESVGASTTLSAQDKQIWNGRLHHGRGRSLAKLGKHEDAWKEAETVKRMIDEGGDAGKQFMPAYHYLAGYLKLEAGDTAAAIEHLKQAEADDPFHRLLLARAYERAGQKTEAKATYQEIVDMKQNNVERALAFPEAKKKLAGL